MAVAKTAAPPEPKSYHLDRVSFGKLKEVMPLPNLIQVQTDSFREFLQIDSADTNRDSSIGLEAVFRSVFPIESPNKDMVLEYVQYAFGDPKYDEETAREKDATFSIPLKATIRLIFAETGEVREKEIFIGDIPMMTARGTFIINGAERVVVSQIHKSPGVLFQYEPRRFVFVGKIVPDKGAWLEFELDVKKEMMHIKIDRKKKVYVTSLLRAIGLEGNAEILKEFYEIIEIDLEGDLTEANYRLAEDIVNPDTEELEYGAGSEILPLDVEKMLSFGRKKVNVLDPDGLQNLPVIINCLDKDPVTTREDAIQAIHEATRPGEQTTLEAAEKEFNRLFFDPKRYDLGTVGRYKFNQKLYDDDDPNLPTEMTLNPTDMIRTVDYLLKVFARKRNTDDIDHLGNRRIRSIGELLANQLKVGFSRMERAIRERMNTEDADEITPQKLINTKPVNSALKEFFASSQLSQFMDQTNPLSELTHKRRLNALGPGGLQRDRASFEVRDVHYTHYGRMCPIETPEGPNIGLILSLTNYASINEFGFIVTPYRVVKDGHVTNEIRTLTAIEEEKYSIAQANAHVDDKGKFTENQILCRQRGEFVQLSADQVHFMDVSPKQMISVSASLIPFLEHDDANRALMGSNMQRQAVPLIQADSPMVGTGMEFRAAMDSGVCIPARRPGKVIKVSNKEIHVEVDDDSDVPVDIYELKKLQRTNQTTCFNQKPVVRLNQKVQAGDLLADGPSCQEGELALGKNVMVAFMPWRGYNFEDAIIVSQRISKDDVFTSIHIEEYSIEARETKMGEEKITRDIPNLSEDAFRNLDEEGIIRVGARVKPNDILVGKVTPKGETDLTPEYKLLHSIFGEKAKEVRDSSLKVPHGVDGTVVGIKVFSRDDGDELAPGIQKTVKVYLAKKSKLQEGDKMAGRHGNKGVVSIVLPEEDMPFLPDGTPVDIVLNPLGVPSRMNVGQLFETLLGLAAFHEGVKYATPVFEGAHINEIKKILTSHGLPESGKTILYDGRTGEPFESPVTVGIMYMLKLHHMVDDKLHARSTGPYSLVTQQPLGGKAQFGGQRFGEMEVWALEAYGAAYTLQEMLTVKSDDVAGRTKVYEAIVRGDDSFEAGIPESFNVLVKEMRALGLMVDLINSETEAAIEAAVNEDGELDPLAKLPPAAE